MADYKEIAFNMSGAGVSGTVEIQIEDSYDLSTNKSTLRVSRVRYSSPNYQGMAALLNGTVKINNQRAATLSNSWFNIGTGYVAVGVTSRTSITAAHSDDGSLSVSISLAKNGDAYGEYFVCYVDNGRNTLRPNTASQSLTLTKRDRISSIASCTDEVTTLEDITLTMTRRSTSATHIAKVLYGSKTLYTSASKFGTDTTIQAAREWFASAGVSVDTTLNVTVSVQTYIGSTAIGDPVTATVRVTADNDMKASTIASCTASVTTLGSISLRMNRKSTSTRHIATVTATAGSTPYTLYTSDYFTESLSITAAREWFAHFSSKTSIDVTVSVRTYIGSTAIGSPVTAQCKVTADSEMKPSVASGWFIVRRVNATAAEDIEAYIKGYSSAEFSFDSSMITMASGATIASYRVKYAGVTKTVTSPTSELTTDVFNTSGEISFTVRVTDSRGRYAEETASITVQDYSPPTLSGISVYRSTVSGTASDEGTYISLKATAKISSISGLTYTLTAAYTAQGGSYGGETDMTSGERLTVGNDDIATNTSYSARITLIDSLGNTAVYEQVIPTAEVTFNLRAGGHGAAFGKYAEADRELQIPGDWRIKQGDEYINPCRAANANMLDNWYFGNPVNQRGQASYSGSGYGIDRWRTNFGGDTVTVADGYVRNTMTSTSDGWHLHQIIEVKPELEGETVSVSFLVKAFSGSKLTARASFRNASDSQISSISADLAAGLISATGTVPPGTVKIRVGIYATTSAGTADYAELIAAKLEIGERQTLAYPKNGAWKLCEMPDYGEQLSRCQRYFVRYGGEIALYGYASSDGGTGWCQMIYPVTPAKIMDCSLTKITVISDTGRTANNSFTMGTTLRGNRQPVTITGLSITPYRPIIAKFDSTADFSCEP